MQRRDRVFIGAWALRLESRHGDIKHRDRTAAPAQSQVRMTLGPLQIQYYFFEECTREARGVLVRGGCRVPEAERLDAP